MADDHDDHDDDEGSGEGGEDRGDGRDSGGGDRGVAERLDRLEERLESLLDRVGGGGQEGPQGGSEAKEPAAGRSVRQQEADMQAQVAKALGRIRADEEKESRLKKVEETVFAERPPVKQGRLERLLWGGRE